jgi:hypothetical protein
MKKEKELKRIFKKHWNCMKKQVNITMKLHGQILENYGKLDYWERKILKKLLKYEFLYFEI